MTPDPLARGRGAQRTRSTGEQMDGALALLANDALAAVALLLAPEAAFLALGWVLPLREGLASLALTVPQVIVGSVCSVALLRRWASALEGAPLTRGRALGEALVRTPAIVVASVAVIALILVGLILLVVPGVYVLLTFFLVPAVLAFERVDGFRALARSRTLMVGERRRLLLPVLVPYALFALLTLLLTRPGFALAIFQVLLSSALGAWYLALGFVVYLDARSAKEGFDVEILAARVEARTGATG